MALTAYLRAPNFRSLANDNQGPYKIQKYGSSASEAEGACWIGMQYQEPEAMRLFLETEFLFSRRSIPSFTFEQPDYGRANTHRPWLSVTRHGTPFFRV
jgi:hypothetical protein